MPDLSRRPSRYATAAVALALVGGYAVSSTDVQVGATSRMEQLAAENASLRSQVDEMEAADDVKTAAGLQDGETASCAAFGTQEEAQATFDTAPAAFPGWDGNGNGVACEQLRSAAAPPTAAAPAPVQTVAATPRPSPTATSAPRAPLPPAQEELPAPAVKPTAPSRDEILRSRSHFGLYAATTEEYDAVEATTAKDTTVHGYFQGFDTPFRAAQVNALWERGEIPLMTWETRSLSQADVRFPLDEVAAGADDAYIRQFAQDVVANGLPLVIRFDHEMNGNWYNWSEAAPEYGNTRGSYVRTWQHVHDVFAAEGANSFVIWLWSPNRVNRRTPLPSIDNYYPGDSYVDWVGMTGYDRDGAALSFGVTYSATLAELRRVAPGKPILLSEVGATEDRGTKVTWIQSFFAEIGAQTDVIGFVWFNYAVSEDGHTNDWRITSSSAASTAFREGIYAAGYGRDRGRRPVLDTSPPVVPQPPDPAPSPTPTPTATSP